jgi:hypothetical protein
VIGVVLMPGRLALRTLDDFHRLAVSVERATRFVDSVPPELVERGFDDLNTIARVVPNLAAAERRLAAAIELATRIDDALRPLIKLGPAVDALTVSTRTLATAVEPLQGASERLGRLAERLPRPRPAKAS